MLAMLSPGSGGGPAAWSPRKELPWHVGGMSGRPECLRQSEQDGCGGQCAQSGRQQAGKWDGIHWTVQRRGEILKDPSCSSVEG